MIYDFRKGKSALFFSSLLNVEYDFDIQEYTLSREKLEQDHIGYYQKSKKNGFVRLGSFLPSYNDLRFGTTPALHIYHCSTTEEMGTKMIVTNSARNSYFSRDTHEQISADLQICKECAKHLRSEYRLSLGTNTFNNFILALEESNRTKQTLVDARGYILNWRQVSFCYRDFKRFSCEKCGFKASTKEQYKFLHTHHINGVKTDNHRSNLQCLCIKCHSEVDNHHRTKFQLEGLAALIEFEEYINKGN